MHQRIQQQQQQQHEQHSEDISSHEVDVACKVINYFVRLDNNSYKCKNPEYDSLRAAFRQLHNIEVESNNSKDRKHMICNSSGRYSCGRALIVTLLVLCLVALVFSILFLVMKPNSFSPREIKRYEANKAISGAHEHVQLASTSTLEVKLATPRMVVVVPFHDKAVPEVYEGLSRWGTAGHPCPTIARQGLVPALDLVFLYNFDLQRSPRVSTQVEREVKRLLRPTASSCFRNIKFISSKLKEEEDGYPYGPTNMFYNLLLIPTDSFTGLYDFMFWMEADVIPLRASWLDKLLYEATVDPNFYVKGSVYRHTHWAGLSELPIYYGHINGNALYRLDSRMLALVKKAKDSFDARKGFLNSFDVAMYLENIRVDPSGGMQDFPKFQEMSHLYRYSDFIINVGNVKLRPLSYFAENYPNTFLVHGRNFTFDMVPPGSESRGAAAWGVKGSAGSGSGAQAQAQALPRLVVVFNTVRKQLHMLKNIFEMSGTDSLRACAPATSGGLNVDIAFSVPTTWTEKMLEGMRNYMQTYDQFFKCFKTVHFLGLNLESSVIYTPNQDFSGPNNQFYATLEAQELNQYTHMLLLEPDTLPVRSCWIERFVEEVRLSSESFWIKGTAYRGHRYDYMRNDYKTGNAKGLWLAMNGNAIYNIHDADFKAFLRNARQKYPKLPYDVGIFAYLTDMEEAQHGAVASTKIHYTSFIQNYGGTPYIPARIREESPDTYLIHSKCRMDGSYEIPNNLLYCYVCGKEEPWSPTCMFKLNSFDIRKGYDRFDVGPDYAGAWPPLGYYL